MLELDQVSSDAYNLISLAVERQRKQVVDLEHDQCWRPKLQKVDIPSHETS
jgi:hypothetical protein